MYTIWEYLYFMEMHHVSEDLKEQGTGTRKYLRQDLTTLGNRVGSGHPCTGLRSGYFGFSGFSGVARKLVKVSEIAEMPQEIAQEASGSCSGASGKSREVLRSLGKGMELF